MTEDEIKTRIAAIRRALPRDDAEAADAGMDAAVVAALRAAVDLAEEIVVSLARIAAAKK